MSAMGAARSERSSAPIATGKRYVTPRSAILVAVVGLIAALAFAGCTTAGASPAGASTTGNATSNPALTGTLTDASTAPQGELQPPAAPTGLHEWVDETSSDVPAYFVWTPPSGPIGGYYFYIKGAWAGDITPPPAICGPTWEKLPGSATKHTIQTVSSQPETYICAYNDAGTSPTVRFTQDTPWVPAKPEQPAAPFNVTAEFDATGGGKSPAEVLQWSAPLEPVSGFYLNLWYVGGDIPSPDACNSSWTKLPASARQYRIPAVEQSPSVFICAFNDAGMSPMVKFPLPDRG